MTLAHLSENICLAVDNACSLEKTSWQLMTLAHLRAHPRQLTCSACSLQDASILAHRFMNVCQRRQKNPWIIRPLHQQLEVRTPPDSNASPFTDTHFTDTHFTDTHPWTSFLPYVHMTCRLEQQQQQQQHQVFSTLLRFFPPCLIDLRLVGFLLPNFILWQACTRATAASLHSSPHKRREWWWW